MRGLRQDPQGEDGNDRAESEVPAVWPGGVRAVIVVPFPTGTPAQSCRLETGTTKARRKRFAMQEPSYEVIVEDSPPSIVGPMAVIMVAVVGCSLWANLSFLV